MATAATESDSLSAYGEARSTVEGAPLDPDELHLMDAYWRASLYLCLGMIYLKDNPLLREPLTLDQMKTRLTQQFSSMNAKVAAYKSTQAFLKTQIDAWAKGNN